MFKTKEITKLLQEVIKTLNEIKENQPPRYDKKIIEWVVLRKKIVSCNDLESMIEIIENTNIRKDKLFKGLNENEECYEVIKSRIVNVINTSIAKEVCKYYKIYL